MANIRAKGIIIKQSDYGEGHRILSIFAEGLGIIRAISYGAGKSKSAMASASQFLCYGTFELFKGTKNLMNVNSIDVTENFYRVCEDIEKLSLMAYLSDITYGLLGENNADDTILRLYLNTVYALAYRNESVKKIKTVYELKLMSYGGYKPQINACVQCGSEGIYGFDIEKGGAVCKACVSKTSVKVNERILKAISYITECEDKRMLAFSATDKMLEYLNNISEHYVSIQLDKYFKSLDYYKVITMS